LAVEVTDDEELWGSQTGGAAEERAGSMQEGIEMPLSVQ